MSRSFKLGVLAAAVMAAAPAAQAFEAGDFVVRAGAVHVAPDDSSDPLVVTGFGPLTGKKDRLAGTEVGVDSNTQLGLRATYMFTEHLGLGVLGATPFKHNIEGKDGLAGFGDLGETKHLPPTITLQYYPMPATSKFQPYAGIGVNYTVFFEEDTNNTLTGVVDATANDLYGTPLGTVDSTDLDLDDSVGVAMELGMDYMLNDNFGLNAAIWWADINTDATISAYSGGTKVAEVTTEVEIDPMVYMVGFTYKF
ncbi:OmpW family outer membrane protein [uncultured Marinobacter sp.]|jgi:outer membrane protein|uniref:OmpW/AlkL family protein n=1 Tax=uncultured Marinobacter sp. TaxID=187379 RepID=UPI000C0B3CDC|nr:outer membrane protein OmpW [Marinobacter sp.]MBI43744.1 outer membrane protein OmpW [Oceanospirillales bacterium]|tara:strand:+ start:214 stop:972 length:759 start_codon:yes stop_codon:yes gene_type:complete